MKLVQFWFAGLPALGIQTEQGIVDVAAEAARRGIWAPTDMKDAIAMGVDGLAELAEVCGIGGASDGEKADAFLSWIEETNRKMGLPDSFHMIREEDVDTMVGWAVKEANPLYPVPVIWDREDFRRLILSVRG